MIKPLPLSYICLAIGILCLSAAFAMTGFFWGVLVIVLIGGLWAVSIWRSWRNLEILSPIFVVLGISIATLAEGSRFLLLASTLAILTAWDLAAFQKNLAANEEILTVDLLIRTHLLRLFSVLILGATLPVIAFALQFDLKFWQVFLLGLVLLLGLSQVFSQLRRSSQ